MGTRTGWCIRGHTSVDLCGAACSSMNQSCSQCEWSAGLRRVVIDNRVTLKKDCCSQQSPRKTQQTIFMAKTNINSCQIFPYTSVNGVFGPEQNREDHRSKKTQTGTPLQRVFNAQEINAMKKSASHKKEKPISPESRRQRSCGCC